MSGRIFRIAVTTPVHKVVIYRQYYNGISKGKKNELKKNLKKLHFFPVLNIQVIQIRAAKLVVFTIQNKKLLRFSIAYQCSARSNNKFRIIQSIR